MRPSYSQQFVGEPTNRNTEWVSYPFTQGSYILLLVLGWLVLQVTGLFSLATSLTIVNVLHGLLTFLFFHWIKGSPDTMSAGEFNGLTFFEQLDDGVAYTPTKKFLMAVVTVLCLAAVAAADYEFSYLAVNIPIFILGIIPKIPEMHRVRLFGINSTPGIDDNDDDDDKVR